MTKWAETTTARDRSLGIKRFELRQKTHVDEVVMYPPLNPAERARADA